MEAKRKDLKTLAKEGRVNIDPELVDELSDEAVQKLLDDYEKKVHFRTTNGSGNNNHGDGNREFWSAWNGKISCGYF